LGYCKQLQNIEVSVWCRSAFRKDIQANHAISGESTTHINFRAMTLMFNMGRSLAFLRCTDEQVSKHEEWPHHSTQSPSWLCCNRTFVVTLSVRVMFWVAQSLREISYLRAFIQGLAR
jgi:hypothetical protein